MSSAREGRMLLRSHCYGALSTLSKKFDGHPFGSITPYVTDHDGSLLILISGLAEHTKNILADPRVSLITHNQANSDIQTQGRVTLMGLAECMADKQGVGQRYLRYFPEAAGYFGMHDFAFYRIRPTAIRFIGGFGKIHWLDMAQYVVPEHSLAEQELAILEHMNQDHLDTMKQYCLNFKQLTVNQVQMIGLDCDGFDLRADGQLLRFDFAEPVFDAAQARTALVALAKGD